MSGKMDGTRAEPNLDMNPVLYYTFPPKLRLPERSSGRVSRSPIDAAIECGEFLATKGRKNQKKDAWRVMHGC